MLKVSLGFRVNEVRRGCLEGVRKRTSSKVQSDLTTPLSTPQHSGHKRPARDPFGRRVFFETLIQPRLAADASRRDTCQFVIEKLSRFKSDLDFGQLNRLAQCVAFQNTFDRPRPTPSQPLSQHLT